VARFQGLAREIRAAFPPSSIDYYADPAFLKTAVNAKAAAKGFAVATQGSSLQCKKHSEPSSYKKLQVKKAAIPTVTRHRQTTSKRCNCPFVLKYALARKTISGAPAKAIRITEDSIYQHGNGCFPCQGQLIADWQEIPTLRWPKCGNDEARHCQG